MHRPTLGKYIAHPHRSLILISIPIIISAVVETLYNVVDAVYVGRLGAEALAAITFAWPVFFVLVSVSLGITAGMSSRISRFIGERDKKQAENTAMHGVLLALAAAAMLTVIGILFLDEVLLVSGASGESLEMARIYLRIVLSGSIFMFISYTLTNIFLAQGDTKTAMKIDVYSLVFNIIMTPVMVFWFGWGIAGAAIATVLAVVLATIQSFYYLHKHSYLHLRPKSFSFSWKILSEITSVGVPTIITMLLISAYVLFLNRAFSSYSIEHVAMFGIVSRLENFIVLPMYGLSVGAMTLVGMFHGAQKRKLVRDISWYAVKIGIVTGIIMGALFCVFPGLFLRLFTPDPTVIQLGIPYLRLDTITFPLMAVGMVVSRVLQGMGKGWPGLAITLVRVFFIAIPGAYLITFTLGLGYLWIMAAMIAAGVISGALGLWWMHKHIS